MEPSDAELMYIWENDLESWHVSNTQAPLSLHTLKEFASSNHDLFSARQLRLIVCLNSSQQPIGSIDLFDFDPYHLRAGIGIIIAERSERKKNYATEALTLLINYCFNLLHFHQLFCNISEDNQASLRLFENQGFKLCGTKKAWTRKHGGWLDEHMLQLFSDSVNEKD